MRVMDSTSQGPENCSTTGFVRFILPGWVPALVPVQGSSFAGPREKPFLQPGDPDHLPLFFPHLLLLLLRLALSGQRTDLSPLRWQPCSGAHQKIWWLPAHTGKHTWLLLHIILKLQRWYLSTGCQGGRADIFLFMASLLYISILWCTLNICYDSRVLKSVR